MAADIVADGSINISCGDTPPAFPTQDQADQQKHDDDDDSRGNVENIDPNYAYSPQEDDDPLSLLAKAILIISKPSKDFSETATQDQDQDQVTGQQEDETEEENDITDLDSQKLVIDSTVDSQTLNSYSNNEAVPLNEAESTSTFNQEHQQTHLFYQDDAGTLYQVVQYNDGSKLYWPVSTEATASEPSTSSAIVSSTSSTVLEIEPSAHQQQTFTINYEGMYPGYQMDSSFSEHQSQQLYDESLVAAASNFEKTYSQQMEGTEEGVFQQVAPQDGSYLYGHEETAQESSVTEQAYMNFQDRKKEAKLKRAARQERLLLEHQQASAASLSPNENLLSELAAKYARQRFPIKLWHLASDKLFEPINWAADGNSLIIDEFQLEPTLHYFFRSGKFSSFLRQLHLYGFRKMTRMRSHKGDQEKVRSDFISEYGATDFMRGNLDSAKKIRRFYGNYGDSKKQKVDDDDEMGEEQEEEESLPPTVMAPYDPSHQPLIPYIPEGVSSMSSMYMPQSASSGMYYPVMFNVGMMNSYTRSVPRVTATITEEQMTTSTSLESKEESPVEEEEVSVKQEPSE